MIDNDIKRITRLTAILTQLQTKRLIKAQELADKFEVSTRTIYRDIKTLEQAGVPIGVEDGKGYFLMEGYRIPPVMFTEIEANALITAEHLILNNKDASLATAYSAAIGKIKAVFKTDAKTKAELLSQRMAVRPLREQEKTSNNLTLLQNALINFNLIRLTYRAETTQESSVRLIEPFALFSNVTEDWTLIAFCRLRQDFRHFRLDRIQKVEVLTEQFEKHNMTLDKYIEKKRQKK